MQLGDLFLLYGVLMITGSAWGKYTLPVLFVGCNSLYCGMLRAVWLVVLNREG